ncbi:potassium channel family protein [Aeromonas rivipollensis]
MHPLLHQAVQSTRGYPGRHAGPFWHHHSGDAGNLAQIGVWGGLFLWLGEFDTLQEAVYHSGVNFATLGYGDIVMSPQWKLLGPLEAVNGALMIGLSGASMLAVLQHHIRKQLNDSAP